MYINKLGFINKRKCSKDQGIMQSSQVITNKKQEVFNMKILKFKKVLSTMLVLVLLVASFTNLNSIKVFAAAGYSAVKVTLTDTSKSAYVYIMGTSRGNTIIEYYSNGNYLTSYTAQIGEKLWLGNDNTSYVLKASGDVWFQRPLVGANCSVSTYVDKPSVSVSINIVTDNSKQVCAKVSAYSDVSTTESGVYWWSDTKPKSKVALNGNDLILNNLPENTTIYVQGYGINFNGESLTEQKSITTSSMPTPTQAPVSTPVYDAELINVNEYFSLGLNPQFTGGTAGNAPKGSKFKILEKVSDNVYYVSVVGSELKGYISAKYLKIVSPQDIPMQAPVSAPAYDAELINVNEYFSLGLNPQFTGGTAGNAPKGSKFKILEKVSDNVYYVSVIDSGLKGYISVKYLKIVSPQDIPTQTPVSTPAYDAELINVNEYFSLGLNPQFTGGTAGNAPKGSKFKILEKISDNVYYVSVIDSGLKGYISAKYLKIITPQENIPSSIKPNSSLVDIDKMLSYARDSKVSMSGQQCAEFVANALDNGGYNISSASITSPLNGLQRNPRINAPAQYAYLKDRFETIDNPSSAQIKQLQPGDIIFIKTSEGAHCHVMICTYSDGAGTIRCSARNNAHTDSSSLNPLNFTVNAIIKTAKAK